MRRKIAVLATLDTKGAEANFLREVIEQRGHVALVIDTGVVGEPQGKADISRDEVARAGGENLREMIKRPTREQCAPVMTRGATAIVQDMLDTGSLAAVLSIGGTQGTSLSTAVMRALPFGLPKIMVSTMASGNVAPWVDTKDITMMFSVTDIMGLNPFSRRILANAASAACGMAEIDTPIRSDDRPTVAITTVGITTTGALRAAACLESEGFQAIIFHAIGTGGRAMEEMMHEGLIDAVLDYSIIEVSNEMHHALLGGGPQRLKTASQLGIPQVICPGAVEVLVFNEPESVPDRYASRTLVRHSAQITDVRLNTEEMLDVAGEIATRIASPNGLAAFLVPELGFDSYAGRYEPFYDPEADGAFVERVEELLDSRVLFERRPHHINDPQFAEFAAQRLVELYRCHASQSGDPN